MSRQFDNPQALVKYCESNVDRLAQHAASGLDVRRLVQGLASVAAKDPKVLDCSTVSILNAVRHCVQLGLEPASPLDLVYIIPYRGEATVVVSYKGLIELAMRSGLVEFVDAQNVMRGDEFEVALGTEHRITHRPTAPSRKDSDITHSYAFAYLRDARAPVIEVKDREQMLAIQKRSKASKGPWVTDWGEMARKTVLRNVCKRIPRASDLAHAIALNDDAEGLEFTTPKDRPQSGRAVDMTSRLKGESAEPREVVAESPAGDVLPDKPPAKIQARDLLREWSGLGGDDLDALEREVRSKADVADDDELLAVAEQVVAEGQFPEALESLGGKR